MTSAMSQPSVLVIDDEPNNFDVIETLLSDRNYMLHYVSNGEDAIAALDTFQPKLILLDVMMPGLNGIEVCRQIKLLPQWQSVPIIMVTALTDRGDLARCLETGADDFISKPVNAVELRARVQSMLRIKRQYDDLQAALEQQSALEAEKIRLLAQHNAELEQKVAERTATLVVQTELIQHNALHDPLTQLPNRTLLLERLDQAIQRSLQSATYGYAVLFLDLDRFKVINDSLGHLVGDRLLKIIAEKLKTYLQGVDLVARFGGDEFVILLEHVTSKEAVLKMADRILLDFQVPLLLKEHQLSVGMSIGVVFGNSHYADSSDLIRDADIAMYRAKAKGTNAYQVFDVEMHAQAVTRLMLETDLRQALKREAFVIYYQPIIDLSNQNLVGFESLVRMTHPTRGLIPPGDFIPIAEETGLIVPLDSWILIRACQQIATWNARFPHKTPLKISINLSVQDLRKVTLLQDIDRALAETGLSGRDLILEITESMLVEDTTKIIDLFTELRSREIQISIDDFGTGYSSLNYLHRLPADHLKIDRSFVGQMQLGNRNYQVVSTIIALSNHLGLTVVAEGIEKIEQLQWLKQLDCEFGQGYLFAKPLTADEIERQFFVEPCERLFSLER